MNLSKLCSLLMVSVLLTACGSSSPRTGTPAAYEGDTDKCSAQFTTEVTEFNAHGDHLIQAYKANHLLSGKRPGPVADEVRALAEEHKERTIKFRDTYKDVVCYIDKAKFDVNQDAETVLKSCDKIISNIK